MKDLKDMLNEAQGGEWDPSFKTHKDTYNSFVKWYDKNSRYMNKYELVDMLKTIIDDIESDSLNELK